MIFRARGGKRKLIFDPPWLEAKFYEKACQKDVVLDIIIRKRTLNQNSYYWVYLEIISKETGNNKEDLHELFKRMFLPSVTVKIKGKHHTHEFTRKKSTTEMNKVEFGEYLERICAYTEISLPNPEDAGYISLY